MQRSFLFFSCLLLTGSQYTHAQIKAFPQAEGFGAVANGGRGGDVYHVTSLGDTNTQGTLRHGIETAPTTGRTIVFDVSGWIDLTSKLGIVKEKRNITIAGQTAPGGGIGVRGNQFSVGADHVVVRHMRFRPGKGAGRVDSAGANVDAQYVIYDHVSAGYSYDENFSVAAKDLTLQWSTVSYGLEDHSAGSLIEQAFRLSMHHNVYAHNNTRNPKARVNENLDWVDNVVYDYNNGFIAGDSDTDDFFWTANFDGNSYITGPGDTGRPMIVLGRAKNYGLWLGTNVFDNDGDTLHDGQTIVGGVGRDAPNLNGIVTGTYTFVASPYATPAIWKDANPQAAYDRVLGEFGATPWNRDEIDTKIHGNVVNRTGAIVSHENQLGISNGGFGTLAAGVAPTDTDRDGMPDAWETKHGTDPNAANNNADFDTDGYTDLEEYLNDLAAFKATGPLKFSGSGRYADWSHWTNKWEPSRVDEVHVDNGTTTVDAVGQKAAIVRVGATAGARGTLKVASGWLEITEQLEIGTADAATVDHEGGSVRILGDEGVHIKAGTYNLSGGMLDTPRLSKEAAGSMSFTGGTLSADVVEFDLVNNGGTISPGNSPGTTHFLEDLVLTSGTLLMEVGGTSPGQYDKIVVDGTLAAGGTLKIEFLNNYVPQSGDQFAFIQATGMEGAFASLDLPQLGGNLQWNTSSFLTNGTLQITTVPEPAASLLYSLALLAYTIRR